MGELKKEFLQPSEEYTPIPFWFWNDDLKEGEIIRQINDFYSKGVNGFVIHPRIGIPKEIPYLSDRFMELVACAVEEADRLKMKVVLYDEAMYPSGSAHGKVVKSNPNYASKGLKMVEYPCRGKVEIELKEEEKKDLVVALAVKKQSSMEIEPQSTREISFINGKIIFTPPDSEQWSILLFLETFTGGHIRGIHFGEDDGEENPPPSSDLLNPEAMQAFIQFTHDRYFEVLGHYFGNTIIGMFTDEPSIMGRGRMKGLQPWTGEFLSFYQAQGNDIKDLPILWFEAGEETKIKRKKFKETINKRLEQTYYQPISDWCEKHKIALTGHPEGSDDIGVLKYFHIPAQDVVWRWVAPEEGKALEGQHSTMGKCSSDSARHRGKRRNGNECFACSGKNGIDWSFSMDDMKWYMDWLFVRGVNLLFPHAFFYSIRGERRYGERPPDVGPNNIWWSNYKKISDYMKRMSWLMTDSINQTSIAVLCEAQYLPWKTVKPLYQNQIEFNYLENEILQSSACKIEADSLIIEKQRYNVLIIEDMDMIDEENTDKLQQMIDNGINVVVYNPQNEKVNLIGYEKLSSINEIVPLLDKMIVREIQLGEPNEDLRISHVTKENQHFYLLVNEGEEQIQSTLRLAREGAIEIWDPWNGCIKEINSQIVGEKGTLMNLTLDRRESRIIRLLLDTSTPKQIVPVDIDSDRFTKEDQLNQHIDISTGWYMGKNMDHLEPIDQLISWTKQADTKEYTGSMFYKKEFSISDVKKQSKIQLDLGEVGEIAELFINDQNLGVKMWKPYLFDITDYIQEGKNTIVIEIKNSLANHFSKSNLDSGLMGPVQVKMFKEGGCL
ncbi:MAG: hypothetical protein GX962_07895 [Epulopiscium sp.]|nr:hypothetical protein [Candidatus Epulonipiscium sp.]